VTVVKNIALNRVRRGNVGGQMNIFPVDGGRRSQPKSRIASRWQSVNRWKSMMTAASLEDSGSTIQSASLWD